MVRGLIARHGLEVQGHYGIHTDEQVVQFFMVSPFEDITLTTDYQNVLLLLLLLLTNLLTK